MSDTHGFHESAALPEADVLVHAGDFSGRCTIEFIQAFNEWLGGLSYRHKIVIAGNHDTLFQNCSRNPGIDPVYAEALLTNCTYLKDSSVTIGGLKFYGSPWQPEFCDWAFNVERNSEQLRAIWDLIPDDTDVLITHGPPHGIRDQCPDMHDRKEIIHVGCELLVPAIFDRVRPKLHIFGHIHEGSGVEGRDGIIFVNASICTANYNPTNPTRMITIGEPEEEATND